MLNMSKSNEIVSKLIRRLERATSIIDTIDEGRIDSKNLYDLSLHISEALDQAKTLKS